VFTRALSSIALIFCLSLPLLAEADQAKIKFDYSNGDEKKAGVWVDGGYVGSVDEVNSGKLKLAPGRHEINVKQAWYDDYLAEITLQPGETHNIKLRMEKHPVQKPRHPAMIRIVAFPVDSAVFIDEQFTGQVNEFNIEGNWLLVAPGKHKIRIALPGYQPFETTVDLLPKQKLKVSTNLISVGSPDNGPVAAQQADKQRTTD